MLVSPLGQTFGLVSGGCLESDIVLRARRVVEYKRPEFVIYDSTEDGNIAAELGLGCNGRIGVIVEELNEKHRELYHALLKRMDRGLTSYLVHGVESDEHRLGLKALLDQNLATEKTIAEVADEIPSFSGGQPPSAPVEQNGAAWTLVCVKSPVRLLIVGGGIDAQPVADFGVRLGWRVTVADHRTVNARPHNFPGVESLINRMPDQITTDLEFDAVFIMSHNLSIDAQWLRYIHRLKGIEYIGLLGPLSRKQEVVAMAGLDPEAAFTRDIHGPMGLEIGGDLPESVAISAIAQCHKVLAEKGFL